MSKPDPIPDGLSARLLAARSAQAAAEAVVEHLIDGRGHRRAFVLHLDTSVGRLRGAYGHLADGSLSLAEVTVDPVAGGVLADALRADSPRGPLVIEPETLPGPFAGVTRLVVAPLRTAGSETDPGDCPRFDCAARYGHAKTCGAGSLPDGAWTRDALGCGLLPVVGLIGVASGESEPAPGPDAADDLIGLGPLLAPMFLGFRLHDALSDAEYFREDLFDSMTEGVLATNRRGDVLLVNRAAEEILGRERHELLGRPIDNVLVEVGESRSCALETLQRGSTFFRSERSVRRASGSEIPISITTAPITARGWGVRGVVISFVDLTPIKSMEREIRRLDRLATLGRFTSAVAHEIRNPLGGILAGVQYLRGVLSRDPDHAEHIAFIESEIQRLNRIVQDLSTATRNRRPRRVPCRPGDVMQRVEGTLGALAEERGVDLVFEDEASPAQLDPDQMQQVLVNLVKNGIEACHRGGRVRVTARDDTSHGLPCTVIEVSDTGVGMPASDLDHIFEPFYSTKGEGTGLGLYVSHGIVDRHGGSLHVSSVEGEGSTFRIVLFDEATPEARVA